MYSKKTNTMKKILLPFLFVLINSITIAQTFQIRTIDPLDTVIFDVSQATIINGNYIDIPVSFTSDDVINALDFSLKYNETNLLYDTIIDNTGFIQMTEFYNPNDSTIRFSSNSFTTYGNLTTIVYIRFKLLGLQMTSSDLNTLFAYLNGSSCSIKLIGGSIVLGMGEFENNDFAKFYPNPASDLITIETSENATIELADISGREIILKSTINANQKKEINIQNLISGIYFVKIYTDKFVSIKKIVIDK